ncbi:spore coat protein [Bacillus xiamenensis]|uniref:spore coat protein n=1 Tax=Bacillus xiamenensis TaxID=1178537 RepID=UPI00222147B7|nr:spore coat protein [Bacillus xiamenensis]MCW1836661.1 spore coat protein [Bacillus xiamenensis]
MKVLSIEESADLLYTQLLNELIRNYDDFIVIKDSENVTIDKTDVTAALSLQATVTTIITLLIQILVPDDELAADITEQLLAAQQVTVQKKTVIQIINCYNVTITLSDASIMNSVQILTQTLNVLLVEAGIL